MEAPYDARTRNWTMLCHLSALSVFLGIPFGNILGPFVVWLFKKNDYPTVDDQGKESMNFQISLSVYVLIAILLAVVLTPVLIGFVLYPVAGVLVVLDVVFTIVATLRASNGIPYRYPMSMRLIK